MHISILSFLRCGQLFSDGLSPGSRTLEITIKVKHKSPCCIFALSLQASVRYTLVFPFQQGAISTRDTVGSTTFTKVDRRYDFSRAILTVLPPPANDHSPSPAKRTLPPTAEGGGGGPDPSDIAIAVMLSVDPRCKHACTRASQARAKSSPVT